MECFTIHSDEIEGRLDPLFYHPKYLQLIHKIKNSKYEIKTVGAICKRIVDGPFGTQLKVEDYTTEGIPLIRVSDVKTGEIKGDNLVRISTEKHAKLKRSRVLPNDVVLTKAGAILGYSAVFPHNLKEGNITSHLVTITCKSEVNPYYLKTFFLSDIGKQQIYRWGNKSTRPELNTEEVKKILIPIPPLEIQNKIAEVMQFAYSQKKQKEAEAQKLLDSISDYLLEEFGIALPELKDKMFYLVDSENVKNNRMDSYYFQPKFNEVKKAVEKGKYESQLLKELTYEIISGQRPKGGVRQISEGVPSLGGEHVLSDGSIATQGLKFIPKDFHNLHLKSKIKKQDVIIVKDGATTGKVGIIPENYPFEDSNINEHVFLIRCKEILNPYYLFSFLKSQVGQVQINREVTGGTIMGIIKETMDNLKIPTPPLETQNKIAEEVKKRMSEAEKLKNEANRIIEEAKKEAEKMILGQLNNEAMKNR